jgi:hypothetical protein
MGIGLGRSKKDISLSRSYQDLTPNSSSPTKARTPLGPFTKLGTARPPPKITTGSKYQDRLKNQGVSGFNVESQSPVHLGSKAKLLTLDGEVRRQISKSVCEITKWENEAQERERKSMSPNKFGGEMGSSMGFFQLYVTFYFILFLLGIGRDAGLGLGARKVPWR